MPNSAEPITALAPRPMARSTPAEDILLAYVEQLQGNGAGHRAICFHLSRLSAAHRREKHMQIATNMLMETVGQFQGRLFMLRSNDTVIICKGITAKAIDQTVEALRYLFNDDPLAARGEEAKFCSVFDLEIGYPQFLSTIRQIREKEAKQLAKAAARQQPAKPLQTRLNEVLEALSGIDLSNMVRRQTVWMVAPGKKPEPKFDELFVSIDRLRAAISPDVDFAKDRQLFQYLTRWLDKHMLTALTWEQFGRSRPLSLNINIATLQSPEFLKFDNERAKGWRGRTILEIQLGDMWSDLGTYLALADLVRQRGYLRCVDGVSYQAVPCINFQHLKVDLVKVLWDDALLQLDEASVRTLFQAMKECGTQRIILSRCGRPEAIKFGQALGVQLFQGWHLDRIQGPSSA